jgi:hypothetical protein
MFFINITVYSTIQKLPFYLIFARIPKTIEQLLLNIITKQKATIKQRRKFIKFISSKRNSILELKVAPKLSWITSI